MPLYRLIPPTAVFVECPATAADVPAALAELQFYGVWEAYDRPDGTILIVGSPNVGTGPFVGTVTPGQMLTVFSEANAEGARTYRIASGDPAALGYEPSPAE